MSWRDRRAPSVRRSRHSARLRRALTRVRARWIARRAFVLDARVRERGVGADSDRRHRIGPIGAVAGVGFDQLRAASRTEVNDAAQMMRPRLPGAAEMDHLNRRLERGAGLEREHEAVGEIGGIERGEGLAPGLVAGGQRRLDQRRALGQGARGRGEPGAGRQRADVGELGREASIDQHDAMARAGEAPARDVGRGDAPAPPAAGGNAVRCSGRRSVKRHASSRRVGKPSSAKRASAAVAARGEPARLGRGGARAEGVEIGRGLGMRCHRLCPQAASPSVA